MLDYFRTALFRDVGGCCADSVSIMHVLKSSFERNRRRGILVDVGANVGNTVAAMIRIFGEQMLAYPRHFDWQHGGCANMNGAFRIYAFEPNIDAFADLQERFSAISPDSCVVQVKQMAVSDEPGTKSLTHLPGVDPMASFLIDPVGDKYQSDEVKVVTLDDFFADSVALIHLLKIDAEGFDPRVLGGAARLLAQRRIKFLVFEYSALWRTSGYSLKDVTTTLLNDGYLCFLIISVALVPISGRWWQPHYESYSWRNVFCGQGSDHDLFAAFVAYGANRFTMSYALTDLRVMPHEPRNASRQCVRSLTC
eukprot:TRINITY_DN67365_c0_g1_i1.p1 TRINITY_DN67365_c0_g1~~TRINITY_DN67365_c0_g1_i1.p1  ORF type:complete len:309 (-),score=47.33 TRINITY_DN67365_c0_g1_i1:521-1447(-)